MPKRGPCNHCGVKTSPLWRNGPPEMPVLCNACGSRWRIRGTLLDYTPRHAFKKRRNLKIRFTEGRGGVTKKKRMVRGKKKAAAANTSANSAAAAGGSAASTLLAIKWEGHHKLRFKSINELIAPNNQVDEEKSMELGNNTGGNNENSKHRHQLEGRSTTLYDSSNHIEMLQRQLSDLFKQEAPSIMKALTGTTLLYNVNPHLSESEIGMGVIPLESTIALRKELRIASLLLVSEFTIPHEFKISISSSIDIALMLPSSTSPRPLGDGARPEPHVTDKFKPQTTSSTPFPIEDDEQDLRRYFQPLPGVCDPGQHTL